MTMINIGVHILVIIALSALLDFSVSATEMGSYYRQVKNIIPTITSNNLGITCEKSRSYNFDYLIEASKNAHANKHPMSNFPLRFEVFKYEIEGPYYLYPIYMDEIYYNEGVHSQSWTGPIGEDFVVINSHRTILGGVTVKLIYNDLNYYPCLPQRTYLRLAEEETILGALKAAVDNPILSSSESNTVGVMDSPKKELVVTQDDTDPQGWNPFMPMKYWKFEGRNFLA
ncbi:CSEP0438 putative effector protein [Blumeria hordei DH14]|uniref:CSEP0438 putative effector protein n=1 Tax=Blumeria graminis f. sp. hordei (strain DH14) TaxID=546991 RepID=N1JG40_BLUG1|nr:CSEP0438 putative effector protein [Blumeria hordei DH14]